MSKGVAVCLSLHGTGGHSLLCLHFATLSCYSGLVLFLKRKDYISKSSYIFTKNRHCQAMGSMRQMESVLH